MKEFFFTSYDDRKPHTNCRSHPGVTCLAMKNGNQRKKWRMCGNVSVQSSADQREFTRKRIEFWD